MRHKLYVKGIKEITKSMLLGMHLDEKYDFNVEIEKDDVILINPDIENILELKQQLRHVPFCKFILHRSSNGVECVVKIPNAFKNLACYNIQYNLASGLDEDGNVVDLD